MRKYWLISILPALLIIWWAMERRDSIPEIHFTTAKQMQIESTISTNGKVDPVEWAAARSETAGVVKTVSIQRGENVTAGEPILSLDSTTTRSELAAAMARRQEAQAETTVLGQGGKASQLATINSSINSSRAAIEVAQRNYDSLKRLQPNQAATSLQVQEAKDALDRAKQQLSAYESQRQTLVSTTDVSVAQARLRDAEAAVASAEHRLALGTIRAPISGTVYQFDLKVGSYLQPGELVALIGNLNRVKVTIYVDEPDLGRISQKLPVEITWDARPGQKWFGHVEKLPTQVSALGTRTVGEVTTVVDNPDHVLLPGVTVNATIVSKVVPNALAISKAALRNLQGTSGVFRLAGQTVHWTPVKTGISDVNNVQVLSGLQQGDKVADRVVDPSDAEIKDGMTVHPVLE